MAEELFKGLTPAATTTPAKAATPTAEEIAIAEKKAADEAAAAKAAADEAAAKLAASSSGSQTGDTAKEDDEDDLQMPSEIDMLKDRAKLMGIQFSNNIGVEALKAKIEEKRAAIEAASQPAATAQVATQTVTQTANGDGSVNALTGNETKPVRAKSLRQHLRDEKLKLIRCRITNLDPKKKDLPGEILTIANEYIGTVRKFVPFGEVTDNGYHIPQCLYDMMKERTFISIKTRKDSKGQTIVEHQNAREFALEILPQLTVEELAQLSASQAAAGGL